MKLSDREEMMAYCNRHDPNWRRAFWVLEELTGVELRTPSIMGLEDFKSEDEPGEVSFLWDYGKSGFLVQLDIWFEEDDTPMVDWFWMARTEELTRHDYDGNEDSIKLTDLPEKVIEILKEEKR